MGYCCLKQHDSNDCGVACLATVLRQYGKKVPISKIREEAGTDVQGTSIYGMILAARKLGLSAKAYGSEDKEAILDDYPLPAIALINSERGQMHYVVIHKINKKYIIYADPFRGIVKENTEIFMEKWVGYLIILVPMSSFEREDEIINPISRFFRLLLPQKKIVLNIFLISLCITIFGVLTSFYYVWIMDDIVPNNLNKTLMTVSIATIILYVFKIVFEFIRNYLALILSQKLDVSLMLGYHNHVIGLPMKFFGSYNVGEIIARFNDATSIRDIISSVTLTVMIDSIMILVGGIILYLQNAKLFIIAIGLVLCHFIVVIAFKKQIRIMNKKQMEKNAQLTSNLVESLNGIEALKSNNAEEKFKNKSESVFVQYMKCIFKNTMTQGVQSMLINIIAAVGGVIILWVGTMDVLVGKMTLGELIAFSSLIGYFLEPIKNIVGLQPRIETAIVAAERLCDILDTTPERQEDEYNKINIKKLDKDIVFENVKFRYGTRKIVLDNVNIKIPYKSSVAFVGKSGSGKSTLVKLLMKFYEIEEGNIKIGDYNLKDINVDTLRRRIAYISQNNFLFNGTIKENLELANSNITLEKIIKVCKMSKSDEFIEQMPLRYNSMIEENGNNLSGGQRQRLAIARALLREPDIMILDEATSHLDSIAEKSIDNMIKECSKDMTRIFIAHRLSTIKDCDYIYVMDGGEIIEYGSHDYLMNIKGLYYEMWSNQNKC